MSEELYYILAEGPGAAHGKKKLLKKNFERKKF